MLTLAWAVDQSRRVLRRNRRRVHPEEVASRGSESSMWSPRGSSASEGGSDVDGGGGASQRRRRDNNNNVRQHQHHHHQQKSCGCLDILLQLTGFGRGGAKLKAATTATAAAAAAATRGAHPWTATSRGAPSMVVSRGGVSTVRGWLSRSVFSLFLNNRALALQFYSFRTSRYEPQIKV